MRVLFIILLIVFTILLSLGRTGIAAAVFPFIMVYIIFYASNKNDSCPTCSMTMESYTPKEKHNKTLAAADLIAAVAGVPFSGDAFQEKHLRCSACGFNCPEYQNPNKSWGCLASFTGMGCWSYPVILFLLFFWPF